MGDYQILTINPGSTSTKIAYFKGQDCILSENVSHDADDLAKFQHISQQLDYRRKLIEDFLVNAGLSLDKLDAVVGRGGGLLSVEGGVYTINQTLLDHAKNCANGVEHPACLGPQLADYFSQKANCPAYVVNPPDTDEYQDLARITGVQGQYRTCHLHALNLKETALHHAELQHQNYDEVNYIVCHIGGGISVSAHQKGKMIDGIDIVGGEGPFAPTRSGSLPLASVITLLQNGATVTDLKKLATKTGGLVSLLGTADAKLVSEKAASGHLSSQYAWDAMIYQIAKTIGQMAAVLKGQVDAILLGGGMVFNDNLVQQLRDYCDWIAPVYAYPGEFEMEAMANGAIRVLSGQEILKNYSGIPIWNSADFSI